MSKRRKQFSASIPPSSPFALDSYCWHFEKLGDYSVRSGYWVSMQIRAKASCSSTTSADLLWWKTLWRMHIPPKIKFFLWKASSGWLPSLTVLAARKVPISPSCFRCKLGIETPVHAIWGCCHLKPVRLEFPTLSHLRLHNEGAVQEFFCVCLSLLQISEMEELCVVWWRLWFLRNKAVRSSLVLDVEDVVPWSRAYLADFCAAPFSVRPPKPLRFEKWVAPSPGWFKLNSDAAVDVSNNRIGLGVVIRDGHGAVVAALAKGLNSLLSVDCAESLAILEGIRFAHSLGISPVGVESDSASVVGLINKKAPPSSELGLIISNILSFEGFLSVRQFSFQPRQCNRVAHDLAKLGVNVLSPCVWVGY
ncbi:hypothetical protein ACOSP7_017130 [Xanthoceras sorbifolium]